MKRFLNFKTSIFLLGIGLFALFGCEAELVEADELVDVQESFSRATNVTIMGTVTDPVTGEPVFNAKIEVGDAAAVSNSNGDFTVKLRETGPGAVVTVRADDRVDFIFPVSFAQFEDNSVVDWTIELPLLQPAISFEPGVESTASFVYKEVTYNVTIPGDVADEPAIFTVGPGGTVVGEGISGAFAVVGIDYDNDDGSDSEFVSAESRNLDGDNYDLANFISITYDPLAAAQSGGIGSIAPAATEPDAPAGAQQAAEDVADAIEVALTALAAGASPLEIAIIFVVELYGIDISEVSENEDGTITVENTIEGTQQPGTGVVKDTQEIVPIGEGGEPIEEEEVPLVDEETGEPVSIPHQGTADGG